MTTFDMLKSLPHEVVSDIPSDPAKLVIIASLSFILHFAVFYLTPIPSGALINDPTKKKSVPIPVIRNYIASTFHAFIACTYVLGWFLTFGWPDLWDMQRMIGGGRLGTGDEYHAPMIAFSLGYFVYDTVCMMMYKQVASSASYVHHICIGTAFAVSLVYDTCRPYQFFMLFEELSTLPLNAKTIFQHNPFINHVSSLVFAASFIFVRMIYGCILYCTGLWQLQEFLDFCLKHELYSQFVTGIFQVAMCSVSRALNAYWTVLIINKVMKTIQGGGSKKK